MLINNMVKRFIPIWKLKAPPIKLIITKIKIPINEFKKSLNINFIGNIKILHKTNKMQSPDI